MRMKNDIHIKGLAPTLVLKQRPGELGSGLLQIAAIKKIISTIGVSQSTLNSFLSSSLVVGDRAQSVCPSKTCENIMF